MEYAKSTYNSQYEKWVPWAEDIYLRWFTSDNKTSYTAKAELDKSKVTGIEQVDTLQDGVNNVAAGQVGQGGLLQPLGDAVSKEGFNRTERQGKDDSGGYTPADLPGASAVGSAAGNVSEGGKAVAGKVGEGLSGVGGLLGGGSKGQQTDQKQ